jgi:hypothetical protein
MTRGWTQFPQGWTRGGTQHGIDQLDSTSSDGIVAFPVSPESSSSKEVGRSPHNECIPTIDCSIVRVSVGSTNTREKNEM